MLTIGIALNLLGLGYYKYCTVCLDAGQRHFAASLGFQPLPPGPLIPLPVGISFFTFQAISYLVDVYRRRIAPARSLVDFAIYHSLFPQLVAGPIVRYSEIRRQIARRARRPRDVRRGRLSLLLGLGKKMLIADIVATVADACSRCRPTNSRRAPPGSASLCYTLQIYFDFSGYSDMAIGLGRMLGFHFPENFDRPYRSAQSITEFWRRWHMTLSRWFRDYLYIPLGGNRHGTLRTYRQSAHRVLPVRPVARRGLDLRRLGPATTAACWSLERIRMPLGSTGAPAGCRAS